MAAGFSAKLNDLEVSKGPPRANITGLTDPKGYPIIGARFHAYKECGTSVILDIVVNGQPHIAFLPKRFSQNPCQAEVDELATKEYKLRCTDKTGNSPNEQLFQ